MIEKFIKKKLRNIWNIVTQRPVSDWGVHDDAYEKSSKTHQKTWEESCLLAHESWRLLFGAKCSRKQSLHFLETRWLDIYHGVGGARHNTESRMELFAVSICSSTNTRSGLFSTVHAYRKLIVQHRRPRLADTNLWEHIPSTSIALSDTRSIACESSSNRKEADIFDFVFCACVKHSVHGKSRAEEKWYQDQLIFDRSAIETLMWLLVWKDVDKSEFLFDKDQMESELWVQRWPKESWILFRPNPREGWIIWKRLNARTIVQCLRAGK